MNTKWSIVAMMVLMAVAIASGAAEHHSSDFEYHQPTMWQSMKNAFSDMNPFSGKLGHDWSETHNRVEGIYDDMHRTAQRQVNDLKEEQWLKDGGSLQKKIADIYAASAAEAERRIDRLKRPLIANIYRSAYDTDHSHDVDDRSLYEKGKDSISDAASSIRRRLSPTEEHSMFEDAAKKISDSYKTTIEKAKTAAKSVSPTAGEAWHETKARAQKAYDDLLHGTHHETRGVLGNLRRNLGEGAHKAADAASWVAVKTWHLILHSLLAGFWLVLGGVGGLWLNNQWHKRIFQKQLNSSQSGPIVLVKHFTVVGNEDVQRKFADYWQGRAANFFKAQNGCRKYSFVRGINVGSNEYTFCSEWNSLPDLRTALSKPEVADMKKGMPGTAFSKHCIGHIVETGKGVANTEGGDVRAPGQTEGLRQRATGGPMS